MNIQRSPWNSKREEYFPETNAIVTSVEDDARKKNYLPYPEGVYEEDEELP
jgi:hypothetical protein